MKQHFLLIFRHGLISATCAASEFSIFMLMFTYLNLNLSLSYLASFITATLIGFVGHSIFTFRIGGLYKRNAIIFAAQASCAIVIGYLIVSSLIGGGVQPAIAKAIQLVLIFFFNVMFGKFLSFKKVTN